MKLSTKLFDRIVEPTFLYRSALTFFGRLEHAGVSTGLRKRLPEPVEPQNYSKIAQSTTFSKQAWGEEHDGDIFELT
jgi:hypothetical protein